MLFASFFSFHILRLFFCLLVPPPASLLGGNVLCNDCWVWHGQSQSVIREPRKNGSYLRWLHSFEGNFMCLHKYTDIGLSWHSTLATVGQTSGVGLKQGCLRYGQDGHRCLSWYFTSTQTIRLIRDGKMEDWVPMSNLSTCSGPSLQLRLGLVAMWPACGIVENWWEVTCTQNKTQWEHFVVWWHWRSIPVFQCLCLCC